MTTIRIYDTTLRDGAQAEDITLSLQDKLKIARKLDELGVAYIEGGWPGSNPIDQQFFSEVKNYEFTYAKITAFGSTHHPMGTAENDANLAALIDARTEAVTIFGKTWKLHATEALRVDAARNLEIIRDSVAFLKQHRPEIIFDAEHFFDGFKDDPEFALSCLQTAHDAGADSLVLCDTNGGTMPVEIHDIVATVRERIPNAELGIHCHNDSDLAVANTLAAVRAGAVQVQGTINGYGERCGNANLCSIIPNLELRYEGKYRCLPDGSLDKITRSAAYVAEVANQPLFNRQPFVGRSAFAHKGGIHVSAVQRNAKLYEHIDPEAVGNRQRVLVTELAGRSNIVALAKRYGFHLDKNEPVVKGLIAELKKKASEGYDYAAAEASLELMVFRKLARRGVRNFFDLVQFRVLDSKISDRGEPLAEATVMVEVEGEVEYTAATGRGPVNALDNALRKGLRSFYPRLDEMRLVDFKVRILGSWDFKEGTGTSVRVLIESSDQESRWVTVGVSHDIIEASWQALADSVVYKLYKDEQYHRNKDEE